MVVETTVCIAGGGPAGVVAGYLLARKGVRVTVLEKHQDFFRDFRGDTVHPSTLEIFYELGLLEEFLKLPHQQLTSVGGIVGDFPFEAADFTHLPTHCKFVALMPQWDFLNFLAREARKFPGFDLRMEHEAIGLTHDAERVTGVNVRTSAGECFDIEARLVLGCDGRHSTIRRAAELDLKEYGVPIDVLWFRISRMPSDPEQLLGNINYGRALILINRGDYFQAGLIVPKGSHESIKQAGLDVFQEDLRRIAPFLGGRVEEIRDWERVSVLTVRINRLLRWWRPGLLCIGDAAHAMSPAGGVGINLAIQDAVATVNLLGDALLGGQPVDELVPQVQDRREFPTRATQYLQVNAHRVFAKIFRDDGPMEAPWQLKIITQVPGIQRVLGRIVGIGFRPEHIHAARSPRSGAQGRGGLLRRLAIHTGSMAGEIHSMLGRYNLGWRVR
ncbi:MAG TPA: FAD-dependent oxidoreductase [Bryobacteraceae bacterium]|nr:FAD-dependent oxidoreductase [Bryobacteraceae bacterium]